MEEDLIILNDLINSKPIQNNNDICEHDWDEEAKCRKCNIDYYSGGEENENPQINKDASDLPKSILLSSRDGRKRKIYLWFITGVIIGAGLVYVILVYLRS